MQNTSDHEEESEESEEEHNFDNKTNLSNTLQSAGNIQGVNLGNVSVKTKGGPTHIHVGCNTDPEQQTPFWERFWKWNWKDGKFSVSYCKRFLRQFRIYVVVRFLLQIFIFGGLTIAYLKLNRYCLPGPVRSAILTVLWILNSVVLGHRLSFCFKDVRNAIRKKMDYQSLSIKAEKGGARMDNNDIAMQDVIDNGEHYSPAQEETENGDHELMEKENDNKLMKIKKDVEEQVKEEFCISIFIECLNLLAFAILMVYSSPKCVSVVKPEFKLMAVISSSLFIVLFAVEETVKYIVCKNSIREKLLKFYICTVFEVICLVGLLVCIGVASLVIKKDVLVKRITAEIKDDCVHDSRLDVLGLLSFPISSTGFLNLQLNELHADTHTRLYKIKDTDVHFENLLKLRHEHPCIHTIIEGDTFSGKMFLARKLCYEFATNNKSSYYKNFDMVLEISLLNVNSKTSIKENVLGMLKSYAGDLYAHFDTGQIGKAVMKERILFMITDVVSEEQKAMVETFVKEMEYSFPKSSSLLFLDPFEVLNSKLSCLYKITSIKQESRKQLLQTITSEKCFKIIEDAIEQRKNRYNEEYHLGQVAMLAMSCDKLSKKDISVRTVLNNYVEYSQERCGLNSQEFSVLVEYGFEKCLKEKKCSLTKTEITKVIERDEQTSLELRNCVALTRVQKRGKELSYRFRRSVLLFGIVKLRNEQIKKTKTDLEIKSMVTTTLNTLLLHPIRTFISDYGPMLCLYGNLVEILFCVDHNSKLQDGRFLTQGEVHYVHLMSTLHTSQFPSPHKIKWSADVSSYSESCKVGHVNLDPDCTEKGFEKFHELDDDDHTEYFLSSRSCVEHCRKKQLYVFRIDTHSNVSEICSRFRYEFLEFCPPKLSLQPYLLVKQVLSVVSKPNNMDFLSLEWTDKEYDVPSRILHITYQANQGFKMFTCKTSESPGVFLISETCGGDIRSSSDTVCEDRVKELFQSKSIDAFEGTIISKSNC